MLEDVGTAIVKDGIGINPTSSAHLVAEYKYFL
jgi:hypothetical protein